MEVKFGNTTKRKNSTLIPAVSTDLGDCILKSPTSVVSPVFEIYSEIYPDYNYCYIPQFHRYYFITDIVSLYNNGWEISCLVDVLATYKTGVLNTTAFVERAASIFNPLIPDTILHISLDFDPSYTEFIEMGVMDTLNGTYILGVAGLDTSGNGGFTSSFAMQKSEFKNLALNFFNDSKLEEMSKFNANPISSIAYCRWVPLQRELISEGNNEIYFGNVASDIFSATAKTTYQSHAEITIPCPYFTENPITGVKNFGDYRNTPPYTTTELLLPGVGLIDIDTAVLLGNGASEIRIDVQYDISVLTGDITYTLIDLNHDRQIFMTVNGNFSVNLPVSGLTADFMGQKMAQISAITSGMTAITGAASLAVGNVSGIGALVSGASGLASAASRMHTARQHHTTIMGSLGGWAGQYLNGGIRVIQRKYALSGSASAVGKPYFNTARLGAFSGYVKCAGAYIGVNATDTEHNMLISMVNGGFYVE